MIRRVDTVTFSEGVGTATYTFTLNQMDLSQARALALEVVLTTIGTDAGDNIDIKLQDTWDNGVTWNTRARMTAIAGTQAASATAPYTQRIVVEQDNDLNATERNYVPSGSSGGSEIAAGSTVHGPFPRLQRDAKGRHPGWRIQAVVTDAGAQNASFVGTFNLYAESWFRVH